MFGSKVFHLFSIVVLYGGFVDRSEPLVSFYIRELEFLAYFVKHKTGFRLGKNNLEFLDPNRNI